MTATVNGDTGFSVTSTGGYTFGDGSVQSTAATGFGMKNRLINGNMAISQRGTSFNFGNNTTTQYGLDRWYTDNTATGIGLNVTQTADTAATYGGPYYVNLAINSIANAGYFSFAQRIESKNTYDLANASCALSFTAALTATGGTLQLQVLVGTPSAADNYTSTSFQSPVIISVTNTPTRFTVPITASATAYNGQLIYFKLINNGTSATNVTLNIGSVQFEKGVSATAFDVRPYGTELALCQRYYYKVSDVFVVCGANATSTTQVNATVPFPVQMRNNVTGPDTTGTAADYSVLTGAGGAVVCNSVPSSVASGNGVNGAKLLLTVAAGVILGQGSGIKLNNSSYLGWSAEL